MEKNSRSIAEKRTRPTLGFIGTLVFGLALYLLMLNLQPHLGSLLFSYDTWDRLRTDSVLYRILWMIGDPLEPHFHKTLFGSVFLLIGSFIAYILDRRKSPHRGIPIAYDQGKIWPWVFAASLVSLGISIVLFGGLHIDGDNYVPTFLPYVSVAPAIIFLYGANMPSLFTGAILGAITTTPITLFIRYVICLPNDLPGVIAAGAGMCIGGIITFEISRLLPWMKLGADSGEPAEEIVPGRVNTREYKLKHPNKFLIRRMLADYTEPMFVGNEIAGLLLILGSLFSWFLNPLHPAYGSGLLPHILFSQVLTGALAMYVYWDSWIDNDWFPSFIPVVSVAPACILLYGGSLPVILISSILGALICPVLAEMVNRKIPGHWHIFIGLTFSIAFSPLIVTIILKYVGMVLPIF